jgi:hypothetical protein
MERRVAIYPVRIAKLFEEDEDKSCKKEKEFIFYYFIRQEKRIS